MIYSKQNFTATEQRILELVASFNIPHTARLACEPKSPTKTLNTSLCFPTYHQLPKQLDLLQISRYLRQLLTALEGLHSHNILHLDVTKANILLDQRAKDIVVIDFGLSIHDHNIDHPMTKVCGTPGYIAPEFIERGFVSPAADVYSAGVTLGQWLEPFMPECNLNLLGSPLSGPSTTSLISRKLKDIIEYQLCSNGNCDDNETQWHSAILSAADLLSKMLDSDFESRISVQDALSHSFLTSPVYMFNGTEYQSYSEIWRKARCGIPLRREKSAIIVYKYR